MSYNRTQSDNLSSDWYRHSLLDDPKQPRNANVVGDYQRAWSQTDDRGQATQLASRPLYNLHPTDLYRTNTQSQTSGSMLAWETSNERREQDHYGTNIGQHSMEQRYTYTARESEDGRRVEQHRFNTEDRPLKRQRVEMAYTEVKYENQFEDPQSKRRYTEQEASLIERNGPQIVGKLMQLAGCPIDQQRRLDEERQSSRRRVEAEVPWTPPRPLEIEERNRVEYTSRNQQPQIVNRLMNLAGCQTEQRQHATQHLVSNQHYFEPERRGVEIDSHRDNPRPLMEVEPFSVGYGRVGDNQSKPCPLIGNRPPNSRSRSDQHGPEIVSRLMQLAGLPTEQPNGRSNNPIRTQLESHQAPRVSNTMSSKFQHNNRRGSEVVSRLKPLASIPTEQFVGRRNNQPSAETGNRGSDSNRSDHWTNIRRNEYQGRPTDKLPPALDDGRYIQQRQDFAVQQGSQFQERSLGVHNNQWTDHNQNGLRPELECNSTNLLPTDIQTQVIENVQRELVNLTNTAIQRQLMNMGICGQEQALGLNSVDMLLNLNQTGILDQLMNVNLQNVLTNLSSSKQVGFIDRGTQGTGFNLANVQTQPQWSGQNPYTAAARGQSMASLRPHGGPVQSTLSNTGRGVDANRPIPSRYLLRKRRRLNKLLKKQGVISDQAQPSQGSKVVGRAQPSQGSKVVGRAQPSQGSKVVGQAQPSQGSKVVGRAQPSQGSKVVGRAQPSQGSKVVGRAQPSQGSKSMGQAQPSQGSRFVGRAQPSQGSKVMDRAQPNPWSRFLGQAQPSQGSKFVGQAQPSQGSRFLSQVQPSQGFVGQVQRSLGKAQPPVQNISYKRLRQEQERLAMINDKDAGFESLSDSDGDDVVVPAERLPGTIALLLPTPTKKLDKTHADPLPKGVVKYVMKSGKEEQGRFLLEQSVANGYRLRTMRKYSGKPTLTLPFEVGAAVNVIKRKARNRRKKIIVDIEFSENNEGGGIVLEDLGGKDIPNFDGTEVTGLITNFHKETGIASFSVGENSPTSLAHFTVQDIVIGGLKVPKASYRYVMYVGMSIPLKITSSNWTKIPGIYYTADSSLDVPLVPSEDQPSKSAPVVNGVIVKTSDEGPSLISCCSKNKCGERFYVVCSKMSVSRGTIPETGLHFGEGTRIACTLSFEHDYGEGASGCAYLASALILLRKARILSLQTGAGGILFPHEMIILSSRMKSAHRVELKLRYIKVDGKKPQPDSFPNSFFKVDMIMELNYAMIRCKKGPSVSLDISKTNMLARKSVTVTLSKDSRLVRNRGDFVGKISALEQDGNGKVLPKTVTIFINGFRKEADLIEVLVNHKKNLFVPPSLFKIGDTVRVYSLEEDKVNNRYTACLKSYFSKKELLTDEIVESKASTVVAKEQKKFEDVTEVSPLLSDQSNEKKTLTDQSLIAIDEQTDEKPLTNTSLTDEQTEQKPLTSASLMMTDEEMEQEPLTNSSLIVTDEQTEQKPLTNASLMMTDEEMQKEFLTNASLIATGEQTEQDPLTNASFIVTNERTEQEPLTNASLIVTDEQMEQESLTKASLIPTEQPVDEEPLTDASLIPTEQPVDEEPLHARVMPADEQTEQEPLTDTRLVVTDEPMDQEPLANASLIPTEQTSEEDRSTKANSHPEPTRTRASARLTSKVEKQ